MVLRAIWQFMDQDVTHKILYGPKRSCELFVILYFASKNKPNFLPKERLEETGNKFDVIMVNLSEDVIWTGPCLYIANSSWH
jgi:hypothetical protein